MRKDFGTKHWVYPMPVFVLGTYNEDGSANAMTAAWGGISEEDEIFICLDDEHKTARNIEKRMAFTVSIPDVENVAEADYVGIVSGNDEPDKMKNVKWTPIKSKFVDAPIFEELPMVLECEVSSWTPENCRLFGKIKNLSVDERILSENGLIDLKKFRPITVDGVNSVYYELGEKIADAYEIGQTLMSNE